MKWITKNKTKKHRYDKTKTDNHHKLEENKNNHNHNHQDDHYQLDSSLSSTIFSFGLTRIQKKKNFNHIFSNVFQTQDSTEKQKQKIHNKKSKNDEK